MGEHPTERRTQLPEEYPGRSAVSEEEPAQLPPDTYFVERGRKLADHWGLALAYGVLLTGTGLVLALWPKESVVVSAVCISVALIISGMSRLFLSMIPTIDSTVPSRTRTLVGVSGILAIVVGVLCLREPLQTVLLVGVMVGVWLLVAGFVDIVAAALGEGDRGRVWGVLLGMVNIVAGGILVVNPHVSLGLLVLVTCVWLFASGLSTIVSAFRTRARQRREA